jgi:16S rRNA (cytosine967-C5)-methyltransferase
MRVSAAQLIKELRNFHVEVSIIDVNLFADSESPPIKLLKRQRLQSLAAYQNGLFEIQDASSQLVAPFLQVKPGMMVIDACAGAGGKALHIASLMKNAGKILAMDVEPKKLRELERRAKNAAVEIIQTSVITPEEIIKNKGKADRLLLDVPCSGLGVLKRNPDAKWKLSAAFIEEIQITQANILKEYAEMLKPEGMMVYATCSILPSENEQQVAAFIAKQPNKYALLKELRVMPSQGYDGFYMALIKKLY